MQKHTALVMISILSLWLYASLTIEYNQLLDIPMPVYALLLAVLITGGYSLMVTRSTRSYDARIIAKLQRKYSVVYVGSIANSHCAVASHAGGIAIYDLGTKGRSIVGVTNIPFGDVTLLPKGGYSFESDRGDAVVIRRNSDQWQVTASLMSVEKAEGVSPISYVLSRFNKSKNASQETVDKLMSPAEAVANGPAPTVVDANQGSSFANSQDASARLFWGTFFGTIAGLVLAIVASLATTAAIDPDARRELKAPFATCARDASKVKTVPVDQSVALRDGATARVHSVTYNVPQDAKSPQEENFWYCAKATLVEVSVDNIPDQDGDKRMRTDDFKLEAEGARRPGKISKVSPVRNTDNYATYIKQNKIKDLAVSYLPEGTTASRGWLVYPVAENTANESVRLLFTEQDAEPRAITLPTYR